MASSTFGILESTLRAAGMSEDAIRAAIADAKAKMDAEKEAEQTGIDSATGLRIASYAPASIVVPVRIRGSVEVGDVVLYRTKGAEATERRKAIAPKSERRRVSMILFTTEAGDTIALLEKDPTKVA